MTKIYFLFFLFIFSLNTHTNELSLDQAQYRYNFAKQNFEIQKAKSSKFKILNSKGLVSDDEYEKSVQKTLDLKTRFLKTKEDYNKTTIKSF